ncbi:MAG: DUF3368 domain-containing protein [Acidobacteriia bacterium]|nr:DUF3368 domain-containing protein [Terriglobia bacterium]
MIAIADTTALNYLILIGHSDLLPVLYGRMIVPEAVYQELQRDQTPPLVRAQMASCPPWLEVRQVKRFVDPSLNKLHIGEQEAITLAEEIQADLLILDEKDGRRAAVARHLPVIGTLGVLEQAAKLKLLDLPAALAKLKRTIFRADPKLLRVFLERDVPRKERSTTPSEKDPKRLY